MSTRTLFIHIPKNAGTSIAASCRVIPVSQKYMTDKMKSVEAMSAEKPFNIMRKHIPFSYLDRNKINLFDRRFAVVRNPWSRLVSLYNYGQKISSSTAGTFYYQPEITWNEFFLRMDNFRMSSDYYWKHPYDQWATQLDWVSVGDKVKCDILRYENIQDDLNSYFQYDVDLSKNNIGLYKIHYTEYYTEAQKQKVADWFRLDIEHFGFTFESGANRNYWTQ